jgi:nucleoside-diphosphate-sugar epimerase
MLRVGALTPTRDFTFVTDTARAFLLSLGAKNIEGEVINLGVGFEVSVSNIIEDLAELTNHNPEIQVEESRLRPEKSEVERLLSDNTKAKKLLSWEPENQGREGFRSGLAKTLDWLGTRIQDSKIDPSQYVR